VIGKRIVHSYVINCGSSWLFDVQFLPSHHLERLHRHPSHWRFVRVVDRSKSVMIPVPCRHKLNVFPPSTDLKRPVLAGKPCLQIWSAVKFAEYSALTKSAIVFTASNDGRRIGAERPPSFRFDNRVDTMESAPETAMADSCRESVGRHSPPAVPCYAVVFRSDISGCPDRR